MKNLLIIAFLAVFTVFQPSYGQNTAFTTSKVDGTGFNGTNFFDSNTAEELQWIVDWVKPGDTIILRLRFDDKETDLASLQANVKNFNTTVRAKGIVVEYIATISTFNTADEVMSILNTLKANGINFFCVELDNEPYARETKYNFNFLAYQNDFEPITEKVLEKWPTMNIAVFIAPRAKDSGVLGGRGDHKSFNDQVFTYIQNKPDNWGIAVHIYLNTNEIQELDYVIPKRVITSTLDADLVGRYGALLDPVYYRTALSLFDSTMNYVYRKAPNRFVYVTEFQYNESAVSKNMLWNSMATLIMWEYVEKFPNALFLEHMGKGNTNAGNISKASTDFDLNPTNLPMLRRTNYWVYQMYREYEGATEYNPNYSFSTPGTYTLWFVNQDDAKPVILKTAAGMVIENYKIEYMAGSKIYSSAGVIPTMQRGSLKSYEISGTTTSTEYTIPKLSLGFITFELKNNVVIGCMDTSYLEYNPLATLNQGCMVKKVYGCMDPNFLDYNPNANMKGACVTPKVYGCTDKKAKNYNPKANVSDGTCCYKKWWQFFSTCPTSSN